MVSNVAQELATLLRTVERPGDFVTSGTVDFGTPILRVEGVGQISLPLLPAQAEQIVAVATRAPFGRGEQTILDTNVRRTWQLGPDKVELGGKNWPQTLNTVVGEISHGLGLSTPIEAQFYKLLLYDKGSFFLPHRDTEKTEGMFATLVLVFPGQSEGGELVVRHSGREQILDLRRSEPGELGYAAFYADCVHEVLPVTSGHRLALTFNVVRKGKGAAPAPPNYDGERDQVAAALAGWSKLAAEEGYAARLEYLAGDDEDEEDWDELDEPGPDEWDDLNPDECDEDPEQPDVVPRKLVYPLQHAYTPAETIFAGLKGIDAAVAGVLKAAALKAGLDLHLALLTIEESGWAEHVDWGARGQEQFEVGEVIGGSYELTNWRDTDDHEAPFHNIPVREHEISPPDFFEEAKPDDEEFREATGNEGASFERTYRRAALVLWPGGRTLDVVLGAGLDTALLYLEDRIRRVAGGDVPIAVRAEALQLAERLIATWHPAFKAEEAARLLAALRQLGENALLAHAFAKVVADGGYSRETVPELLTVLSSLTSRQRVSAVRAIIPSVEKRLNALSALLAALPRSFPELLAESRPDLQTLVDTLPTKKPPSDFRVRYERIDSVGVVDLVAALAAADAGLALQAVRHMLAHPGYFALDGLLVKAAEAFATTISLSGNPAVEHLVQACRKHLETRIAEPLAPPADWRRQIRITCGCEHCASLKMFMADPVEKVWNLRARQEIRSHVETNIRNARCDLTFTTLRQGSPHALVCTKNQSSYEQRVKQRRRDLEDSAKLA